MVKDMDARFVFFFKRHITLATEITNRSTSLKFTLHSEQTGEAFLLEVKCIFHSGLCRESFDVP